MKVLPLNKCNEECPHFINKFPMKGYEEVQVITCKLNNNIIVDRSYDCRKSDCKVHNFPEWCPLEDIK